MKELVNMKTERISASNIMTPYLSSSNTKLNVAKCFHKVKANHRPLSNGLFEVP